jgi:hypothetical protein
MNNFYDDCFDMVPSDKLNLAVEQLSVKENGDVGVAGSLSVDGALYVNKWATIASDGTSSHLYMRGSGNPNTKNVDVNIAVTGGIVGQADQGVLTATSKGGITLDGGSATVLNSSLYISILPVRVPISCSLECSPSILPKGCSTGSGCTDGCPRRIGHYS